MNRIQSAIERTKDRGVGKLCGIAEVFIRKEEETVCGGRCFYIEKANEHYMCHFSEKTAVIILLSYAITTLYCIKNDFLCNTGIIMKKNFFASANHRRK